MQSICIQEHFMHGVTCEREQGSIFCTANFPPQDLVTFQGKCRYSCVDTKKAVLQGQVCHGMCEKVQNGNVSECSCVCD